MFSSKLFTKTQVNLKRLSVDKKTLEEVKMNRMAKQYCEGAVRRIQRRKRFREAEEAKERKEQEREKAVNRLVICSIYQNMQRRRNYRRAEELENRKHENMNSDINDEKEIQLEKEVISLNDEKSSEVEVLEDRIVIDEDIKIIKCRKGSNLRRNPLYH